MTPIALAAVPLAAGLLLAVARTRLTVLTVQGSSMSPSLLDGDRVLLLRSRRLPRRGAIVAVRTTGLSGDRSADLAAELPDLMVKRLVAVAGDPCPPNRAGSAERVPAGRVFLRGDNRRSLDSRTWGTIPQERVIGRVMRKL